MKNQIGSRSEEGQLILVLILIMTVALAIGLSIVQKSLVDLSTASKVEQSSRAFSAAEAGVEKALRGDTSTQVFTDNNSKIEQILDAGLIPAAATSGTPQVALEYPPLAREDVAQVWLADFSSSTNPPAVLYNQPTLDVYWGNSSTDKTAIELTLVYYNGTIYASRKWYIDNASAVRSVPNGFDTVNCVGTYTIGANTYQCKKTLGDNTGVNNGPLPVGGSNRLMLLRVRLLYNSTSQPFAVQAVGTCGASCSLPSQARSIISTGVSGETQRRVKLFQLSKVVLPYFDYAIFSAGAINK